MIQSLFENLNNAMSASVGLSLFAAFAWGVLSIILSPCHLASIPLIVGFINGHRSFLLYAWPGTGGIASTNSNSFATSWRFAVVTVAANGNYRQGMVKSKGTFMCS